jgi:hypothetical protein
MGEASAKVGFHLIWRWHADASPLQLGIRGVTEAHTSDPSPFEEREIN